jgi:hypothetical protein
MNRVDRERLLTSGSRCGAILRPAQTGIAAIRLGQYFGSTAIGSHGNKDKQQNDQGGNQAPLQQVEGAEEGMV